MTDRSASGLRLLLVDDDLVDRARVRRLLAPAHTLREATTAAEARAATEADAPEVVLLDYHLPDADGPDVLAWFAARDVPVVMLTGVDDAEVIVASLHHGAGDYLVKGRMDAASLERALRGTAETASLRRAVAAQQGQLAQQAAALDARHREVRELASALTLAEQAERARISALLHDHLQQYLFGAQMMLLSLRRQPDREGVLRGLTSVDETLRQCIDVTRRLTLDLTPPVLDGEDYGRALEWLATHVTTTHGLAVTVSLDDPVVIENRELRVLLTEMVRELLFNAVKHAGTGAARVRLSAPEGAVRIAVEDDGAGFDPATTNPERGFGLFSVRGRLELFGGHLVLDTAPGAGTRAVLTVPLDGADRRRRRHRATG